VYSNAVNTDLCLPPAPSAPVSGVIASEGTSQTIRLSWSPPPTNNWNGLIQNYTIGNDHHSHAIHVLCSCVDYVPVDSCDQMTPLDTYLSGSITHTNLENPASPRDVTSLVTESVIIAGLEEFVSYAMTVAVTSNGGTTSSTTGACDRTQPACEITVY